MIDRRLGNRLYRRLGNRLYRRLGNRLYTRLGNRVYRRLGNRVYRRLGNRVYRRLGNRLYRRLGDLLLYNPQHLLVPACVYNIASLPRHRRGWGFSETSQEWAELRGKHIVLTLHHYNCSHVFELMCSLCQRKYRKH